MAGGYATTSLLFTNPFRVASNTPALNLVEFLDTNNREIISRQLRVATGERILRPEDGAAFYAISRKVEMQIRAKEMAIDNIGDAKDLLSVAEAGLLRIDEMLERMRDVVVRAANDTLTPEEREDVERELGQLASAIDEIVRRTRFNETDLMFDGGFEQTYQVGPSELSVNQITVKIGNFFSDALGIDPDSISVANNEDAQAAITAIDNAVGQVKDQLIRLGAIQSELTSLENVLSGSIPPEESVKSLYGDADIAQEQVALTRLNLFSQLASAQAAAANGLQSSVFSLLA
jgi:flagellin